MLFIFKLRYANGDVYKGYFKAGQRFGHGVLQQGRHLSSPASTYVGEWLNDRCHGYGVQDDILKGDPKKFLHHFLKILSF